MNHDTRHAAPDNPGEESNGTVRNSDENRGNYSSNASLSSSSAFPPLYPCSEVCSQCGKKATEALLDDNQDTATEPIVNCTCECHLHTYAQHQKSGFPQIHVPPGGPNCLPGCGYSGLPCYNCGMSQSYLHPVDASAPSVFPTQVYTVELMNPSTLHNFPSQESPSPDQRMITESNDEDSPEARMRRRTCISLVVFIITLNVIVAIFRMLGDGTMFYG